MKTRISVFLLLIGILFVPQLHVFAQTSIDEMTDHMRFTHSEITDNLDEIAILIKNNHTKAALNLLQGTEIKVNHLNSMLADLIWEMSNKGH